DHAPRTPEPLGHRPHREGGRVRGEHAIVIHTPLQLAEDRLLYAEILDHGLHDQVGTLKAIEREHRLDPRHRALYFGARHSATRGFAIEQRPRVRQRMKERLRLDVAEANPYA